jgi:hypothetical protein
LEICRSRKPKKIIRTFRFRNSGQRKSCRSRKSGKRKTVKFPSSKVRKQGNCKFPVLINRKTANLLFSRIEKLQIIYPQIPKSKNCKFSIPENPQINKPTFEAPKYKAYYPMRWSKMNCNQKLDRSSLSYKNS